METLARPKLIRRKAAKSVITQPCEKCGAEVNIYLVSATSETLRRGTCEACGQRAEKTDGPAALTLGVPHPLPAWHGLAPTYPCPCRIHQDPRGPPPGLFFRASNLRKADFCLRWFHFRRKLGKGKRPLAAVERDIAPYPVYIGNYPVGEGAQRFAVLQGDGQKGELKQGDQENQGITDFVDGRKK